MHHTIFRIPMVWAKIKTGNVSIKVVLLNMQQENLYIIVIVHSGMFMLDRKQINSKLHKNY